MKRFFSLALALGIACAAFGDDAKPNYPVTYPITFQCGTANDLVYCPVGFPIRNARLYVQLSRQPCVYGYSWGWDNTGDLWVSNGCRGSFVVYGW